VRRRPRGRPRPRQQRPPDVFLLISTLGLVGMGLVMVFSSSTWKAFILYDDSFHYLKRQAVWACFGVVALAFCQRFEYWRWRPLARVGLFACLSLLMVVLLVGQAIHGSRRWLDLGPMSFGPSEAVKLALVIYLAYSLSRAGKRMAGFWSGLMPHLAVVGVVCVLVLLQPDLGTAVAIAATSAVMLFLAGARLTHLLALGTAAAPMLMYLIFQEPYRRRRFFAFLNPWDQPLGSGFHIIQSLYALGSGGPLGVGLGQSRQKFFYLPEQHTDFIFAIIGEELGFLGCLVVIALFALFAWRGFRAAAMAPDAFSSLLAAGITSMVVLQTVVNIGVVTAVLPVTGIPLPLVSYGGSSLLFTLAGVGVVMNVSRYSRA